MASKESPGPWGELGRYPRREEARQHRRRAEEEARASYNTRLEARKTNRSERDRTSVNLCIEKDERKRSNIEEIKTTIVSSLGDRNPTLREEDISTSKDQDHGVKEEEEEVKEEEAKEEEVRDKKINKAVKKISNTYSIELAQQIAVEEDNLRKMAEIPPRSCATLSVSFTPRQFSNPARESKKAEEEQWLRKQARAKDRKQQLQEELQLDHDEILQKCGHFFRLGDLDSAEEILNHGLELFPASSQLINNR